MDHDTAAARSPADVAERLRRLQQLGVRRGAAGLAVSPPRLPAPAVMEGLPGRVVETAAGPCLIASTRYELTEQRGGWSLAAALQASGGALAACGRDAALAELTLRNAAFLDTETSGLAGGAGTFAFMVGIGLFDDAYTVHQVVMRTPAEEPALLQAISDLLADRELLVTFNGRSFDAPLLNTRYALQRLPSPLRALQHLDLLPPARQRWRLRLPSCALGSLEQDIFAMQRSHEDVPGWLIPSIYQEFARGFPQPRPEVVEDMTRVFYHNREDIVTMVPLAAALAAPFEQQGAWAPTEPQPAADWLSLARCYEELGWHTVSEAAYRRSLRDRLAPPLRSLALQRLADLLRRLERRAEAAELWQEWIVSVPGADVTPYEELAKHHEWYMPDLAAARKWTLWGLHTAQQLPPGAPREAALLRLTHRLQRLERKLVQPVERAAAATPPVE
ncbi:MAG: ribonuclease H-like domain-containing protein [Caldilineales bacterium]